ncbi:MAG: hypothetical protein KJS68_06775 [Alphaproteobacteria bacterium]|nr:hypothetical protein [Alphaproteobacteria bacterium]MDE2493942.1 hypothetical protein [Alphaproteobacteria bacterium]
MSLGLPVAYLGSLLLFHVPGALAHAVSGDLLYGTPQTKIGFTYATIGTVCFVMGAWLSRSQAPTVHPMTKQDGLTFWLFCLFGGWAFIYILSPLHNIPSVGAVVDEAGAVWTLGVLLGLGDAFRREDLRSVTFWSGALVVYPIVMLLLGGFLSYGSAAIIIATSALTISARGYSRAMLGVGLAAFLGLSLFVNYFHHRDAIRQEVWGGAPLSDRIDSIEDMFMNFRLFDPTDPGQAEALDARLNQNYFVGLAAERIESGQAHYLYGRSIWQALEALVPRAIWPDKPVTAGSGDIVSEMTGLTLSSTTSWGVGNVMEFQINFGLIGVVFGFIGLGWLIGLLDMKAALALRRGDFGQAIVFFLPAVALIDPQGSMVELASGSASALIAGYGWKWLWENRRGRSVGRIFQRHRPRAILANVNRFRQ